MVGNSKHKHFTERDQRLYYTPTPLFWVSTAHSTVRNVAKQNSDGNSKITELAQTIAAKNLSWFMIRPHSTLQKVA